MHVSIGTGLGIKEPKPESECKIHNLGTGVSEQSEALRVRLSIVYFTMNASSDVIAQEFAQLCDSKLKVDILIIMN